jgi:hypothetical protein
MGLVGVAQVGGGLFILSLGGAWGRDFGKDFLE